MKRVLPIFLTFFVLTFVFSEKVLAACEGTNTPEFHSLRPYPANPCQNTPDIYAKFCGNDLTLHDTITETYPGDGSCTTANGKITCNYNETVTIPDLTIDLSIASLPIMGNTEDVTNSSKNSSETLDDAQKVNNYVSWYLNGVINRAEYGDAKNTASNAANFSGPIQKLLPGAILDNQRIQTINNAGNTNHNQVVVCADKAFQLPSYLSWIPVIGTAGIGKSTPVPCYGGRQKYRLEDWRGNNNLAEDVKNLLKGYVSAFLEGSGNLAAQLVDKAFVDRWDKKMPPLPWENDPFASPPRQMTSLEYQKYYNEWRGDLCALVPSPIGGKNFLLCVGIPGITNNEFADLYSYVPLSGTEDIKGGLSIDSVSSATNPVSSGVTVQNVTFSGQKPATLFFAHMQESDDLANLLQDTFVAKNLNRNGSPTDVASGTSCNTVEVRSNKGDNLFANQLAGQLKYNASFSCSFEPPTSTDVSTCVGDCIAGGRSATECISFCSVPGNRKPTTQTCSKDVYIGLSTTSSTPKVDDIWSRLVAGPMSVFKRIFPKTNTPGGIGQIMDIPGSTNITYSAPNVSQATADIKFPHIGGISEYFLKGIQTILRPKGYGEPVSFAPTTSSCKSGSLPEIPAASENACKLCSYPSNLPKLMVDIFEAASQAYNVPASVIYATFMHEGGSHYTWDDASARQWSVCGGEVPNCDKTGSTSQPPYGWFPVYFYNGYWDAVKVIDPGRTEDETSPCNFLDATFATAKALSDFAGGQPATNKFPLSQDPSQTYSRIPDVCLGFNLNNGTGRPGSCSVWNTNTVVTSQVGYGGWCPEVGKHPIQPYFPDISDWIYQTVNYYQSYTCH